MTVTLQCTEERDCLARHCKSRQQGFSCAAASRHYNLAMYLKLMALSQRVAACCWGQPRQTTQPACMAQVQCRSASEMTDQWTRGCYNSVASALAQKPSRNLLL